MKKIIALTLCLVMLASLFVGCGKEDPSGSNPSETTPSTDSPTQPTETEPVFVDPWADYECITIEQALALCEEFVDAPSETWYYIRATIDSVDNPTYGQLTISDGTGSIMVYGSYNADGTVRYDAMEEKPAAGDEILIYGCLQNYKGNTKEVQKGWIIDYISNSSSEEPSEPAELPEDGSELTIAELLALPLAEGQITEQHYIVRATVESISNAAYGEMYIGDGTGSISVYNSKNADGSVGYADMEDKPYKGDSVVLKCTVQNYYGDFEIKQAYILEFTHADISIDPSEYTVMSISSARDTALGTKVNVTGVVAQITYANGMVPSGVILVDGTSSIYVYDGNLAARVAVGNTINICASKTYWILDSEQSNASKFNYKGCNQLENATLISNDEGSTEFDKSWIETTTVKDILDTPVSVDITTKIYKVNALIVKSPGNGFTNYYINDLDGKTGSYAYTQCNGNDFSWLDAFDGKICTVYLMALNAKSTTSDCYWRFLPVAVMDEGFDVTTVDPTMFAVKYYGIPQFLDSYSGNPALELISTVDSPLLGFTGVQLSYTSADPSIISFDGNVMNCHKSGTVTISVIANYGGKQFCEEHSITVTITDTSETYPTVADAIAASIGDKVTVKGIVGPSLVNKTGFYLIDDTGVIAVETTEDVLATLEIGYEVVLEANRGFNTKGESSYGETCLKDATVVANNYGKHDYSTASFKGNITVEDFYNLDINTDYTTSVFTMTATVVVEESQYYTNILLSDGTTKVRLYCSSASQYNWLKAYAGQEVTVEIAACNWNSKTYYTGCVLAVVNADGSKVVNSLNFN